MKKLNKIENPVIENFVNSNLELTENIEKTKSLKIYTVTADLNIENIDLPLHITFLFAAENYSTVWPAARLACRTGRTVQILDADNNLVDFDLPTRLYTVRSIFDKNKKSKSPSITLEQLVSLAETCSLAEIINKIKTKSL